MDFTEKSIAYLKNGLDKGTWKPGDQLPTIRVLANAAQVSSGTMAKAVAKLIADGVLCARSRKGVWVGASIPNGFDFFDENIPMPRHVQKWEQIKTRIANDVLNGKFGSSEPLPSLGEMKSHYAVSYGTLHKALGSLQSAGFISTHKKTFRPELFSSYHYKTRLLFLTWFDPAQVETNATSLWAKGFIFGGNKGNDFFSEFEQLCHKKKFAFDILGYSLHDNTITFVGPNLIKRNAIENLDDYYGICVLKTHLLSPGFSSLVMRLGQTGKPVAVIDSPGNGDFIFRGSAKTTVHHFSLRDSEIAGKKIGRFLLELGHRDVAFISPCHKEFWSEKRYRGLCNAFELASEHRHVHLHVLDQEFDAMATKDGKIESVLSRMPSFVDFLKSQKIIPEERITDIKSLVLTRISHGIFITIMGDVLEPVFEKAYADRRISAWVCADDRIALLAQSFLLKKKAAIPQEVSVIGFENTEEAIFAELSSYEFDVAGVAQAMIAFFLNPEFFKQHKAGALNCDGFIVPRGTTGPHVPSDSSTHNR